MTPNEMVAWGRTENATRIKEINECRSQAELKAAQERTKKRRVAVGLSAGQAAVAVGVAQNADANDWTDEQAVRYEQMGKNRIRG